MLCKNYISGSSIHVVIDVFSVLELIWFIKFIIIIVVVVVVIVVVVAAAAAAAVVVVVVVAKDSSTDIKFVILKLPFHTLGIFVRYDAHWT